MILSLHLSDSLRILVWIQNIGAYQAAIFAMGYSAKWQKALSLLDEMAAKGIEPDERCYVEAIKACGKVRCRHKYPFCPGLLRATTEIFRLATATPVGVHFGNTVLGSCGGMGLCIFVMLLTKNKFNVVEIPYLPRTTVS